MLAQEFMLDLCMQIGGKKHGGPDLRSLFLKACRAITKTSFMDAAMQVPSS